jgi:hypothetical protein
MSVTLAPALRIADAGVAAQAAICPDLMFGKDRFRRRSADT